jgi:hypothetical protein
LVIALSCSGCPNRLSSGAYGHTLGHAVGMGWVAADQPIDRAWIDGGSWQVEVAGERFAARASLDGLYDPATSSLRPDSWIHIGAAPQPRLAGLPLSSVAMSMTKR